jgi:transposase
VPAVGPQHFGIVSVEWAKARSKGMLADFFGTVLIPPTTGEQRRPALAAALTQRRQAMQQHDLRDLLVAIERTGRSHHVVRRAFAAAGLETRIVHPLATKRLRQPSDPGTKTDDTELLAIHRAAGAGFALVANGLEEAGTTWQIRIRQRRRLGAKAAPLRTQSRAHLEAAFAGLAACFEDRWERDCALQLVRPFASPAQLRTAGREGLGRSLDDAAIRYQRRTLAPVLHGAAPAAAPDLGAAARRRGARARDDDCRQKDRDIQAVERDRAAHWVTPPSALLLAFPGINVVSAAACAGDMGPIAHYANARASTGRAGLRPSR